jgi:hypothetical protein
MQKVTSNISQWSQEKTFAVWLGFSQMKPNLNTLKFSILTTQIFKTTSGFKKDKRIENFHCSITSL